MHPNSSEGGFKSFFADTSLSNSPDSKLKEALRCRLIECGWRDQVASMCRDVIQKQGIEHIKLEQIVNEVHHKARMMVPEEIRSDMLGLIRKSGFIETTGNQTTTDLSPTSESITKIEPEMCTNKTVPDNMTSSKTKLPKLEPIDI